MPLCFLLAHPATFDARDESLRQQGRWRNVQGPRVGDCVELPNGKLSRISVKFKDRFQIFHYSPER